MSQLKTPLNDLNHAQIRDWLERALRGDAPLQRLERDETAYMVIFRMEETLDAPVRRSLYEACNTLIRRFCETGKGEAAYLKELLGLAARFKSRETSAPLKALARRFEQLPGLGIEVRQAVLEVLVTGVPPQPLSFWQEMLRQQPQLYAAKALSGALAHNAIEAVQLLPAMRDNPGSAMAAALKLGLEWDKMAAENRARFLQEIVAVLPRCNETIALELKNWLSRKGYTAPVDKTSYEKLMAGLKIFAKNNLEPSPAKLCQSEAEPELEPLAA